MNTYGNMDEIPRRYQICQGCKAPCVDEFQKVAGLQNSGLLIFVHKENRSDKRSTSRKKDATYILHNASEKELKRSDYIGEMCQYRTKCFQCRTVIQRVRSLLDEITNLKKNEVLGVCEHCKRANPAGKCRRCEYIVNKFLCNKVKMYEDRQARFKTWLCKVNQLLHNILECENVCKHKLFKESASTAELEKLLQELRSPLELRQPEITFFPNEKFGSMASLTQSKDMLEELLIKLKSGSFNKRISNNSLFVSPSNAASSCVCKYFMDRKFEGRPSIEVMQETPTHDKTKPDLMVRNEVSKASVERSIDQDGSKEKRVKKTPSKDKGKTKSSKEKTPGKENISSDKADEKIPKKGKAQKPALSSEEAMMLKMLKERGKEKNKKEKLMKAEKVKKFAKIESLPQLKMRELIEVVEEKSESVVECSQEDTRLTEMIKGTKIVPFDHNYRDEALDTMEPLLYKIDAVCPESTVIRTPTNNTPTTTTTVSSTGDKGKNSKPVTEEVSTKGIIKYELSNREFIEKGWTILPSTKIMRRLNIYKMEPASPKYDWFERHKIRQMMFYGTGERLAEIDGNGRGKWFYKSGMVALDYYNAQELNAGQRYVVYSSGEEIDNGKGKPKTVLASFDYLGNGVVYDHYGNVRLKYNQTEGMVIDEKIGPPGRWRWHSLNEPPILQPVFVDNYVKHSSPCLNSLLKNQKDDRSESSKHEREPSADMLAIELENFIKEKTHKLLQKYKPFKIRSKVLKVNGQFSLRLLDQANIYLLFRDGHVSLKLNLGMLLISSEIVDTDTAEVSEVSTPYDRYPPKSQSVADIQYTVNKARKVARNRATDGIPAKKSDMSTNSY